MVYAVLQRLAQMLFVMFGISALVFLIFFGTPGADPAARIAGRILGQGDVVSLVEKAAETVDEDDNAFSTLTDLDVLGTSSRLHQCLGAGFGLCDRVFIRISFDCEAIVGAQPEPNLDNVFAHGMPPSITGSLTRALGKVAPTRCWRSDNGNAWAA